MIQQTRLNYLGAKVFLIGQLTLSFALGSSPPAFALRQTGLEEGDPNTKRRLIAQLIAAAPLGNWDNAPHKIDQLPAALAAAGAEETVEEMVVRLGRSSAPITREQVERIRFHVLQEAGEVKEESLEYPDYIAGENSPERLSDLLRWMNAPPEARLSGTPSDAPFFEILMHPFKRGDLDPKDPIAHAALVAWAMAKYPIFGNGNHRTGWALMNAALLRDGVIQQPLLWEENRSREYYDVLWSLDFPKYIAFIKSCFPSSAAAGMEEMPPLVKEACGMIRLFVEKYQRRRLPAYERLIQKQGDGLNKGEEIFQFTQTEVVSQIPGRVKQSADFQSDIALVSIAFGLLRTYFPILDRLPARSQMIPLSYYYNRYGDHIRFAFPDPNAVFLFRQVSEGNKEIAARLFVGMAIAEALTRAFSIHATLHQVEEKREHAAAVHAWFAAAGDYGLLLQVAHKDYSVPEIEAELREERFPYALVSTRKLREVGEYYQSHPIPIEMARMLVFLIDPQFL